MITLRLRNDPSELARLEDLLRPVVGKHGLSAHESFTLQLLLEEVVSNVITHAYEDEAEHEILVRLSVTEGEVHIEIEDDGKPFDPTAAPPVDTSAPLDQREVGGVGIHLVRRFADDVRYTRDQGRNVVSVTLMRAEKRP